jgi:tRNA A37 threonylcarbamoyladenosine synthetase subunit TsaC/SUA5/YrdC
LLVADRNQALVLLDADLGGDRSTVGLRCPAHSLIRSLARVSGPIATTSANPHEAAPFDKASEVATLEGVALVIDGGRCAGVPSTAVAVDGRRLRLLRSGALDL